MNPLYIVSTPIGNKADITIRALTILFSSDIIACEDTRRTSLLLSNYSNMLKRKEISINGIDPNRQSKLISYYDEVEIFKADEIVRLIREGKKVSLVSDSGTPLVADPGFKLIQACFKNKIPITAVPGPSALVSSLTVSGFPPNQFLFLGFAPNKSSGRVRTFAHLKDVYDKSFLNPTVIFYESPHRIYECLKDLERVFGDIEIVIAREMTKLHEEVIRARISSVLGKPETLIGEITVLFRLGV